MAQYKLQSEAGLLGEKLALRYLKDKGYGILATNYYHTKGRRTGEIDIIAKKSGKIAFIEVKTRLVKENFQEIFPEEQVTRSKLYKLEKTASRYLKERHLEGAAYGFHVVTVCYNQQKREAKVRHLEDVFF